MTGKTTLPNTGTGAIAATGIGGNMLFDFGHLWYTLIAFALIAMALSVVSQVRLRKSQQATGQ